MSSAGLLFLVFSSDATAVFPPSPEIFALLSFSFSHLGKGCVISGRNLLLIVLIGSHCLPPRCLPRAPPDFSCLFSPVAIPNDEFRFSFPSPQSGVEERGAFRSLPIDASAPLFLPSFRPEISFCNCGGRCPFFLFPLCPCFLVVSLLRNVPWGV